VKYAAELKVTKCSKKDGGMLRQFIPAKLADNPTLIESDPDYLDRLEGLGNEALVKAMKDGDWDIVAGGALDDVWDQEVQVVPRFKVPADWKVDRSFDWGSSRPFSVGWWAEATGEAIRFPPTPGFPKGKTFCPPKGSLVRVHEWYGSEGGVGTNIGLKMGSDEVAKGIKLRESILLKGKWVKNKPEPGPADSSIFSNDNKAVDCVAESMLKEGVGWLKSDRSPGSRKNGLQLLRNRLKSSITGEGVAMFFMEHCTSAIDLLPVMIRDEKDPEDVDTDSEDHLYDEVRYKCLSLVRRKPKNLKLSHAT
jgi:hypothetical protein